MQQYAKWISDGPDSLELEAVLASGLHDGLHEDEIEDMQRRGIAFPQKPVIKVPPRQAVVSAVDWFTQNYPKLKPEDLAEFYRSSYQTSDAPIKSGTQNGFDSYRTLLAERVRNANIAMEKEAEPAEPPAAKELRIAPELVAGHRVVAQSARDRSLPRTGFVVLLAFVSLMAGGAIGMGLASKEGLWSFFGSAEAASQIDTRLTSVLRK